MAGKRRVPWLRRTYRKLVRSNYAKDLLLKLQLAARDESVAYIQEHMTAAIICSDRYALHRLALDHAPASGLLLEFGVKKGGSIGDIAAMTERTVHGFDSFEGLPEDWAGTPMRRGKFSTGGKLPNVSANVRLHPGLFEDSLPLFIESHADPLAFMHVDCDLYSSTKTIFAMLAPYIVVGSVIVFDEYFNYPNWREHEFRAFHEFVETHGVAYDYLGFTSQAGCVAVKVTDVGQVVT